MVTFPTVKLAKEPLLGAAFPGDEVPKFQEKVVCPHPIPGTIKKSTNTNTERLREMCNLCFIGLLFVFVSVFRLVVPGRNYIPGPVIVRIKVL